MNELRIPILSSLEPSNQEGNTTSTSTLLADGMTPSSSTSSSQSNSQSGSKSSLLSSGYHSGTGRSSSSLLPHHPREDDPGQLKKQAHLPKAKQDYSSGTILAVVAFYWATSLSVVFLNKFILSSSEYKFPYPLVVTWYQLLVALVLLVGCGTLGRVIPVVSAVPRYEFDLDIALKVVPLAVIYVLMLALNNLCLRDVHVTFYQVARSLTILFNLALTRVFLGSKTSYASMVSCMVVFLGFVLGAWGEMNFSASGLLYGVGSSLFVALYGIYVKKSLAYVENNQWRLLHYNTTLALLFLPPLIYASGELEEIMGRVTFLGERNFWLVMTATGITGWLINIAVFLQIKVTTPLTNTISGTAKACVQTLVAWCIWQNVITALNGFGIFLSLFGSGLYSYVRYKEMQRK